MTRRTLKEAKARQKRKKVAGPDGVTYHSAPTWEQDAEVVAVRVENERSTLRIVCCQGNYFAERHEVDLMNRPRWVDASARDVAQWMATLLSDLRKDPT
jgi:hypothetical protein